MDLKKIDEHFNTHGFSYISRNFIIKYKLSLNSTGSLLLHYPTASKSFSMVWNK